MKRSYRRRQLLMVVGAMMILVAVAVPSEADTPQVEGFSVGIVFDDLVGTTQVGARASYWWQYVGVDISLHANNYWFDVSDDFYTETLIEQSQGYFGLGVKAGAQIDRAKLHALLGFGGFVEEGGAFEVDTTLGTFDFGLGVDFAVSEHFVIGLNFLDVRVYSGVIGDDIGSVDLDGVAVRFLQGGHVSFQF